MCGKEGRGGEFKKEARKEGGKRKEGGGEEKTTFNPNPRHLSFEYTPFETYLLELVIEAQEVLLFLAG